MCKSGCLRSVRRMYKTSAPILRDPKGSRADGACDVCRIGRCTGFMRQGTAFFWHPCNLTEGHADLKLYICVGWLIQNLFVQ